MINTILWDIDGTLLDFVYSEKHALKKTFSLFGYELSDEDIAVYSRINDSYWTGFDKGEVTKQGIYEGRLRDFFDYLKVPEEKRPAVAQINDVYQNALGEEFRFFDGAYETVSEFKGHYRQYIVTNGSATAQNQKISGSGLDKIMDGVFISELMGLQKPNVEYFDKCFEQIGSINKNETVIIGDSLTSDIRGGKNADIRTIWYNPSLKMNTTDIVPDFQVDSLRQIKDVIIKL